MELFFLICLTISVTICFFSPLLKRETIVQIPFWAGYFFLGWIVPQFWALYLSTNLYLTISLAVCLSSFLAIILGWNLAYRINFKFNFIADIQVRSLSKYLLVLYTIVGSLASIRYISVVFKANNSGELFGLDAFMSVASLPLYIAAIIALTSKGFHQYRNIFLFSITSLTFVSLYKILILGRRQEMLFLAFLVLIILFIKKIKIRFIPVILAIAFFGNFIASDIGNYRKARYASESYTINSIDYYLDKYISDKYDVRNSVHLINSVWKSGDYDFGIQVWNSIIKLYIPGFLVGAEFKNSLLLKGSHIYIPNFVYGTTQTGYGSAFKSFGIISPLYWLFISFIISSFFISLNNSFSRFLYVYLFPEYIASFGLSYSIFVSNNFYLLLLILPFISITKLQKEEGYGVPIEGSN